MNNVALMSSGSRMRLRTKSCQGIPADDETANPAAVNIVLWY